MKISYNWLKELIEFEWSPEELGDRLTLCGTACEYIEATDQYMGNVIVGEITAINPVKGADKIRLATVNLGSRTLDVICGAPNIAVGQKVPVATIGAKLAGDIVIKKAKIRGIESEAMICSERELGLSEDHSGIMVLANDAVPGTDLSDHLDYKDYQLTFELTPNRPDSMSAIGIARDIAALLSGKVTKPSDELTESKEAASDYITVKIDDPHACPRYAARMIKNVKIGQSPWWLKKKLIVAGIRPISNIVDITNLIMLETGHPLHAFDYDRFGSKEVVVRRARDKEKFVTLDNTEHECTPDVLLITNGKEGVAAGGVMGGLHSEVEDDTVNILLEAAYFNPSVIRKSRKKLVMTSESSSRFEKGADPNGVEYAINRAALLMQQLCGGEVLSGIVDCYPNKIEPKTIPLRSQRCNDILGITVEPKRMKQILTDLEFDVTGDDNFEVTVPTFRPDIEREIDLIEEVVRIIGYDNIPNAITNIGPLYTPNHFEDEFFGEIRTILTGCGFDEIISHGLASSKKAEYLNPDLALIQIANPLSTELNVMRRTLIQTALNIVAHNINHRSIDLCLFEIGKVYFPPDKNDNWVENFNLSLTVTGNSSHTWRDKPREFDFYDISGAITGLAEHFKWGEVAYQPAEHAYFDKELSFDIIVNKQKIGHIGQVTQAAAKRFEIKQTVVTAELDLHALMARSDHLIAFKDLPVYPAAPRDLAMIVDETIKASDLIGSIKKTAGQIAESVEIFDLYTGKQIEKGKKSIAISINYRSIDGNLSSSEVEETQNKVINELKNTFNVIIREK